MKKEVVVLIPGFLGFEQIGGFFYFADRVVAALRTALMAKVPERNIQVIPVATLPTERLASRQQRLLQSLVEIDQALGGVSRFHLLGHSTGGVDALHLLGAHPIEDSANWGTLDPQQIRPRIKTILSLASPHHGTCLAMSPLARYFRHPITNFPQFVSFAEAIILLMSSLKFDRMARDAVIGALSDAGAAGKYVFDVLRARVLTDDLRPDYLGQLNQDFRVAFPDVRLRSIVTMAGAQTRDYVDPEGKRGKRKPDAFFNFLYEQTAERKGLCGQQESADRINLTVERLKAAADTSGMVIRHPEARLRPITPELNDGLVNSARQLFDPGNPEELWAIVVADHIDVMGYYPRWTLPGEQNRIEIRKSLHTGLLHSGSGFSDEQFYQLMVRIAEALM